jgi:hypothetical protein
LRTEIKTFIVLREREREREREQDREGARERAREGVVETKVAGAVLVMSLMSLSSHFINKNPK